jgi:endonuclease/exonuclease/phosphatase family metal-dependent hydrolase
VAAGRLTGAACLIVALVAIVTAVAPQRTGVLALVQIVLPHLVIAALLMGLLLGVGFRSREAIVAVVVLAIVAGGRFGSEWISLPIAKASGSPVAFVSWNLELGARPADEVAGPLLDHQADVIALQELTPDAAKALDNDPRIVSRYPYRSLAPDPGTLGVGILSTFPIVERSRIASPAAMVVTLDLGAGRRLRVVDVHPTHGLIGLLPGVGLPITYDARERDATTANLHTRLTTFLGDGTPLVVLGDFNTTPSEPGYVAVSAGFRDVQVEIGAGPGWTWRPSSLEWLGIGLLRIDMVLVGPRVEPVSYAVDCAHPGDHCIVAASVTVP